MTDQEQDVAEGDVDHGEVSVGDHPAEREGRRRKLLSRPARREPDPDRPPSVFQELLADLRGRDRRGGVDEELEARERVTAEGGGPALSNDHLRRLEQRYWGSQG